jgi:hypothetical protein
VLIHHRLCKAGWYQLPIRIAKRQLTRIDKWLRLDQKKMKQFMHAHAKPHQAGLFKLSVTG